MCGRFTVNCSPVDVGALFGVTETLHPAETSFNVAPGQGVPVVWDDGSGRRLDAFRWGLIPSWAKDPSIGNRLINARAETVAEKPAFRQAFLRRRCLILADGFYEWKAQGGRKVPFHITVKGQPVFPFAGLWEIWAPEDGEAVRSCCIVTTAANDFMREIHERMPVILDPAGYGPWLDPKNRDAAALLALLKPFPSGMMRAHPVSTRVNSPKNNDPACILPLGE
jgi:putative SOS response-associated peptidase YedK